MRGLGAAYGFLVAILIGSGLGYGLDRLTHHTPFGLLAGIFLGFVSGLYSLYKALMADIPPPPPGTDGKDETPK